MTDDPTKRLAQLRAGLEGLVSCFEGERLPELEAMDATWGRVMHSFEQVRAELARRPSAREDQREAVEDCLRLYAVAVGMLGQRRQELGRQRSVCAGARARLHRRAAEESGASCDLSA